MAFCFSESGEMLTIGGCKTALENEIKSIRKSS
jgi:hypothetical protein